MGFITTVSNPLLGRVKLNTWDVSKEIIQAKNAREAVSQAIGLLSQLRSDDLIQKGIYSTHFSDTSYRLWQDCIRCIP